MGSKRLRDKKSKIATFIAESHSMSVKYIGKVSSIYIAVLYFNKINFCSPAPKIIQCPSM